MLRLVKALLGQQPTRRFWEGINAKDDDETKDDLEGNGEPPRHVSNVLAGSIVSSEVNPVGNHGPDGNGSTFDTDIQTTTVGLGAFGLVSRDGCSVHSIANASNNTAKHELKQRDVTDEGSHLNDNTDDHDSSTGNDSPATTETVTEYQSVDSTGEATLKDI